MTNSGSSQYAQNALQIINLDDVPFGYTKNDCKKRAGEFKGSFLYTLWHTVAKRQYYYQQAMQVINYCESFSRRADSVLGPKTRLRKMFDALQKYAHKTHIDTLHQVISSWEQKTMGQVLTASENPHSRMSFWRFVQMLDENEVPTDLSVLYACNDRIEEELSFEERFQEMINREGEKITAVNYDTPEAQAASAKIRAMMDEHLRDVLDEMPKRTVIDGKYTPGIRQWVRLYYLAGHRPTDMCAYRFNRGAYLTKPVPAKEVQDLPDAESYRSLKWWSRYGIMSLGDILVLPAGAPEVLLPVTRMDDTVMAVASGSHAARRNKVKSAKSHATAAFEVWPESLLPRIPLLVEKLLLSFSEAAYEDDTKEIDQLELKYFHQIVTVGQRADRRMFWGELIRLYLARMESLRGYRNPLHPNGQMYTWEMAVSSRGLILEGLDPETQVRLVEYGRGGVAVDGDTGKPLPLYYFVNDGLTEMLQNFDSDYHDYASVYEAHLF